jgi:hypothetical protein
MSAGTVPSNEYLIESAILNSNTSSVSFSNLGQYAGIYQHLQLRMVLRGDRAADSDALICRFNGDTGNNYSVHSLGGEGGSAFSANDFNYPFIEYIYFVCNSGAAGAFDPIVMDILDPFETTKFKTVKTFFGSTAGWNQIRLTSGSWRNTNAITSIVLQPRYGSNFAQHSRISLYGVTA